MMMLAGQLAACEYIIEKNGKDIFLMRETRYPNEVKIRTQIDTEIFTEPFN